MAAGEEDTGPQRRSERSGPVVTWSAGLMVGICAVIAALHVVWAFTPWPLHDWADWNRTVMGSEDVAARSGPGWAASCFLIAGLLVCACYVAGACAGLFGRFGPWWGLRVASWGVAAVLLTRGLLGFVTDVDRDLPFHDWDLYVYSPLCVFLSGLSAVAALTETRRPRQG